VERSGTKGAGEDAADATYIEYARMRCKRKDGEHPLHSRPSPHHHHVFHVCHASLLAVLCWCLVCSTPPSPDPHLCLSPPSHGITSACPLSYRTAPYRVVSYCTVSYRIVLSAPVSSHPVRLVTMSRPPFRRRPLVSFRRSPQPSHCRPWLS
jgi:hypothetical protein